jgi:hypothetical protein
MLNLLGPQGRFCDGMSRRSFLSIGSLAVGELTLPGLLRAEQLAGRSVSGTKSIIMVYLSGGLAHQDSFDLKPDAPDGIRGEFKPIETNVPGIQIGELLPKLSTLADKFALVRSIVGLRDEHSSFQTITGHGMNESQRNGIPHFGSIVSKVQGPSDPITPPFIDLFPTMQHRPYNAPGPGSLGPNHAGVKADGEDVASMKLRYISPEQFTSRRQLLDAVDGLRREIDSVPLGGAATNYERAFDVLTSSKLVNALDVSLEDPAVRARYTGGSTKHQGDGAPLWNDHLLMARRLVEAGVRVVTVAYGFWDTHGGNFRHMKQNLPVVDAGLSSLIEDIHQRGLDRDVTLLVWGEFGRTPKINKDAGRDHWPRVNGCLFAGGGLRTGQVVGSTDKHADSAATRPVHYHDVIATAYHTLGIDPHEFFRDVSERPTPILPGTAQAIRELV